MGAHERFPSGFLLLCFIGAFAIFSSTMSKSPTLSWFSQYLGASDFEVGLIASASTVTGIFVNVAAGSLSDVYGRRRLLIASCLVFATAPFLYLLVRETWQLALIRVYHGFATAIFVPVSLASITDLFPSRRGEVMGVFSSSTMIGRLLAPFAAGVLVSIEFLAPFQLAYLVCGVSGSIALLASLRLKVESKDVEKQLRLEQKRSGVVKGLKIVMKDYQILLASSTLAAMYFGMGAVETFMPLFAVLLGIERWKAGFIMTVQLLTITLFQPFMGRASDRYGRKGVISLGLVIAAVSLASLPFTDNFVTLLAVMFMHGLGMSATTSSIPALISEVSSKKLVGSALGALETIKDVGHASGPVLAGLLINQLGYFPAFWVTSVFLLAVLAVFQFRFSQG